MPKFPRKPNHPAPRDDDEKKNLNELIPRTTESRCNTCQHPYRDQIDLALAAGYSYQWIASKMEDLGLEISVKSLERHRHRHLQLDQETVRDIVERNQEAARAVGSVNLVSGKALLDLIVQKGFNKLINDDLSLEAKDVIKAAELLGSMMDEAQSQYIANIMNQFNAILEALRNVCTPEQQEAIAEQVKQLTGEKTLAQIGSGEGGSNG
jgi:hypothetical protein